MLLSEREREREKEGERGCRIDEIDIYLKDNVLGTPIIFQKRDFLLDMELTDAYLCLVVGKFSSCSMTGQNYLFMSKIRRTLENSLLPACPLCKNAPKPIFFLSGATLLR